MKAKVVVKLKEEVPDFQGRVVGERLVEMGFGEVKGVRFSKIVELELEAADREAAKERVEKMCRELLSSSVSEEFEIESVE